MKQPKPKFNAILINPLTETVRSIETDGDFKHLYKELHCDLIECVYVNTKDALFLDEEGLFVDPDAQRFFLYIDEAGQEHFIAGRAVIIGINRQGDSAAPVTSLQQATGRVQWLPHAKAKAYAAHLLNHSPQIVAFG